MFFSQLFSCCYEEIKLKLMLMLFSYLNTFFVLFYRDSQFFVNFVHYSVTVVVILVGMSCFGLEAGVSIGISTHPC